MDESEAQFLSVRGEKLALSSGKGIMNPVFFCFEQEMELFGERHSPFLRFKVFV